MDISKAIAEFMGGKYEPFSKEIFNDSLIVVVGLPQGLTMPESLRYNSSWDWQVPVWSKLNKEMRLLLSSIPKEREYYTWIQAHEFVKKETSYNKTVLADDTQAGFEIIGQLLNQYNNIKNEHGHFKGDS